MIVIIAFAFVGLGLFCSFLFIGLWDFPGKVSQAPAIEAVRQIVKLDGLAFAGAPLLSDDADYRMLLSHPALRETARKLRRDRRDLSLLWIGLLRNDLRALYRFRRFLVGRGAAAGLGEEMKILSAFVLSLLLLEWGGLVVRVAGPFALRGMARRVRAVVDLMSYAPALALSRIPRSSWPELQQSWAGGRA
jgi:hypothetical protein